MWNIILLYNTYSLLIFNNTNIFIFNSESINLHVTHPIQENDVTQINLSSFLNYQKKFTINIVFSFSYNCENISLFNKNET